MSAYPSGAWKVLQDYEDDIVYGLKNAELVPLSERLYKDKLISWETKGSFSTLDHERLDPRLQVRYLIQNIYEADLDDQTMFISVIKIFHELGSDMKKVCKILEHNLGSFTEFLNNHNDNPNSIEKCLDYTKQLLSEEDVSVLTELLAEASDKWEEIGITLGLLEHERKECQNCSSNVLRLNRVLTTWIKRRNAHAKSPTLDNLKHGLKSKIVGRPRVGDKIDARFIAKKEKFYEISHTPTITSLTLALSSDMVSMRSLALSVEERLKGTVPNQYKYGPKMETLGDSLILYHQSSTTMVVYGKSALVSLQATSSRPLKYQWSKDGVILSDSDTYTGVNNTVLHIDSVRPAQEGKYRCCVSNAQSCKYTDDIAVSIIYSPLTRRLSKIYSSYDEVPREKWPPVLNPFYIDIDLVIRKNFGNIKHDHDTKERMQYEKAFSRYENGALILIEGLPGSGKTTLLCKIAKDWACTKNVLAGAEAVLLIHLQHFSSTNANITLSDLLKELIHNDDERNKISMNIEKTEGDHVCIIIDGLDEYEHSCRRDNLIYKLIHKKVLQSAMVIVASRPGSTTEVRVSASVSKHIYLLGFTDDMAESYIKKYHQEDKADKLWKHLKKHNILRLCYLPVHAAMICFLYDEVEGIPSVETKIYEKLTFETIIRNTSIPKQSYDHTSFLNSLPADIRQHLNKLCKLAFDMIVESKQEIYQRETEIHLSDSVSGPGVPSLGLVTIGKTYRKEEIYTFAHLTFQEYLAAFYLAKCADRFQLDQIKNFAKRRDFQNVLKFFCGMTNFDDDKLGFLEDIMFSSDIDALSKIHFAQESQQPIVCDSVVKYGEPETLSFTNNSLNSIDFSAVVYVMSNSSLNISKLVFAECDLSNEGVMVLVNEINMACSIAIQYLGYHKTSTAVSDLEALNVLLQQFSSLEILDLEDTLLGSMEMTTFEDLKLPKLKVLKLNIDPEHFRSNEKLLKFGSNKLEQLWLQHPDSSGYIELCKDCANIITEIGCVGVISPSHPSMVYGYDLVFCCNSILRSHRHINFDNFSSCSHLVLVNCDITDEDIKWIFQSSQWLTQVKEIHLDFNRITSESVPLLCSLITKCTKLEVFSAHCNGIDDSGALSLATALAHINNSVTFGLQCNNITDEGVKKIEEVKKCRNTDFTYYLRKTKPDKWLKQTLALIHTGGIYSCASAIKCCIFAHRLVISDAYPSTQLRFKSIFNTPQGAEVLGGALKYCENLQSLDIKKNCFSPDCAVRVFKGINCYTSLDCLDVSCNSIGLDGTRVLAAALTECKNISILYLSSNNIGAEGAIALADGLKECVELQRLDLSENDIGSKGAIALAEALKSLENLNSLKMHTNNIGSDATSALADAIRSNITLDTLQLDYNHIGSDGAKNLAEGLVTCTELSTVLLKSNKICSAGSLALTKALRNCKKLQVLNLVSNHIDSEGARKLADELTHFKSLTLLFLGSNKISCESEAYIKDKLKCSVNLK